MSDVFLYPGEANPNDVVLSDPTVVRAGAGVTYTLTADPGALALTGTSASMTALRLVSASPGALALTGTSASITALRLVTASPGALALTGASASVTALRLVAASPGALALTVTDATLTATRLLTAQPGAVSLAGTGADVTRLATLTATAGSIAIAGTGAALTLESGGATTYTLTADSGTVVIVGTAAGLTLTPAAAAPAESSGFHGGWVPAWVIPARPRAAYALVMHPGALRIAGGSASFTVTRNDGAMALLGLAEWDDDDALVAVIGCTRSRRRVAGGSQREAA